MAYGVMIQNAVMASNIDTLNRAVKAAYDVENGTIFSLSGLSSTAGEGEVWEAATPATGLLSGVWMAYEPEVVITVSGTKQYKGINPDVRDFYVPSGNVFSAFKPQVGDILTINADGLAGTKSTNGFVVATVGAKKLTWAASAISGLSLKLLKTTYIPVGNATLGSTQRDTAYMFEVVAN